MFLCVRACVCVRVCVLQLELDAWLPKRRPDRFAEGDSDEEEAEDAPPAGMTLDQLCELTSRKLAVQEPEEVVRRAFRAFDRRAKGYVSLGDLEAAVDVVAPQLPRHSVALAFGELDADGDGRVAYGEFYHMMLARPSGRTSGAAGGLVGCGSTAAPRAAPPAAPAQLLYPVPRAREATA